MHEVSKDLKRSLTAVGLVFSYKSVKINKVYCPKYLLDTSILSVLLLRADIPPVPEQRVGRLTRNVNSTLVIGRGGLEEC